MATTTFLSNATVAIGAVDVSDQVQSVTLTTGFNMGRIHQLLGINRSQVA